MGHNCPDMLKTKLCLLILLVYFSSFSQDSALAEKEKTAKVNVMVTDMGGKVSKGEQILFKNNLTQKITSGRSNDRGEIVLELPVGASYLITVKSLTDTTRYGMINIPALKEDEHYTEPFKVNVKFETAKTYTLDNVHFDVAKASLRPGSFAELEELVAYLKNKTEIIIEIAGHTDNVGKDADNLRLSQQRADTIRDYIIKKGIEGTRVSAKGYGASEPVAPNDTEKGRQSNRRTEVHIL
jgi:outer membrane protein OmpA-like peptidoglycan-associated protein